MPVSVLRSRGLIDAPLATVGAALRHTRTAERGLTGLGVRGQADSRAHELLVPGDEIAFHAPVAGVPVPLRTRVVDADEAKLGSILVAGPLRELRHETVLAEAGAAESDGRTLVTEQVHWVTPFGLLGSVADVLLVRGLVLNILAARVRAVRGLAESWAARPIVVGTAIVHNGRLLAQQRRYPARHAGRWELPGGRVDPGESEPDAVVRECKEELDIEVTPSGRVGTDVPLDNGMLLRVHRAELTDPAATPPRAVEHREVRWIRPPELVDLDWLDADRVLMHSLRDLLRSP